MNLLTLLKLDLMRITAALGAKPTGRTKFYEHIDIFMGRKPPSYAPHRMSNNTNGVITTPEPITDPTTHHTAPKVHNICCSTCNLDPLIDLLENESISSPDSESEGWCEDESRIARE
eukprot:jgi/Psemu1/58503/gm1.58503_g